MDLKIVKYCKINSAGIHINGKKILDPGLHDSPETSLNHMYRLMEMNYLKFFKMDNLSKLSVLAAECLLKGEKLIDAEDRSDMAVVLSNSSSSIATDFNYQQTINNRDNYFPSPSLFVYTLPNISIGEICIRHKIYGENVFLVNQKFNADVLCFYVTELFHKTNTISAIAGWTECTRIFFEAFLFLVDNGKQGSTFGENELNKLYKIN
jgi:hypothetical protein